MATNGPVAYDEFPNKQSHMHGIYEPNTLCDYPEDELYTFVWDEEKEQWVDERPDAMRQVQDQMFEEEEEIMMQYALKAYKNQSCCNPDQANQNDRHKDEEEDWA